jgi:hypothetical protein
VSENRLVIDLSEILHLEIYCNECKKLSILPITDHPEKLASKMCPYCQQPFTAMKGFQEFVDNMQEMLKHPSIMKDGFTLRLVIQQ